MNTEYSQRDMLLLGDLKRPMHVHAAAEIAICKTKAQACRVALMRSGMVQEAVADRMPCTKGYMSLLLNGKRRWTDQQQFRFEQITGSFAPHQWDVMQRGLSVYVDPVEVRRAQLIEELKDLNRRAA